MLTSCIKLIKCTFYSLVWLCHIIYLKLSSQQADLWLTVSHNKLYFWVKRSVKYSINYGPVFTKLVECVQNFFRTSCNIQLHLSINFYCLDYTNPVWPTYQFVQSSYWVTLLVSGHCTNNYCQFNHVELNNLFIFQKKYVILTLMTIVSYVLLIEAMIDQESLDWRT